MSEDPAQLPDTARGRATRARIVAVAAELMHLRGVGATSIADVLVASGTGKSQIYHYFSGKDQLVEAVMQYQLDQVLGLQRQFDLDTWDGIRRWFDAMLGQQEGRAFLGGCPLGSIVAEVGDRDHRLRAIAAGAFRRWEDALASGLRGLRDRGELRDDADPGRLALETMASIQGGYLLSTTVRRRRPMEVALNSAYERLRSYAH